MCRQAHQSSRVRVLIAEFLCKQAQQRRGSSPNSLEPCDFSFYVKAPNSLYPCRILCLCKSAEFSISNPLSTSAERCDCNSVPLSVNSALCVRNPGRPRLSPNACKSELPARTVPSSCRRQDPNRAQARVRGPEEGCRRMWRVPDCTLFSEGAL